MIDPATNRSPQFWQWVRRTCLVLISISFAWLVVTAWQPIRLNWGDPWSDIDIMTAGRFMAEDGFIETQFTPIVDIKPLDDLSFRYVHYPPLGEIINGVVQRITGSDSLTMFRLLFIAFSALSVLFFFRYVRRIWGEHVGWIAAAVFATNSLWLKYADCIHSHPLHLMTGFGALYWLTRWIDHRKRTDLGVFLGWCIAAFMSSYDYYFFLPLMLIATPWLLGHGFRSKLTLQVVVLGALGCGAGLALKLGLAIWALGWDAFLRDLHFQFLERATDKLSFKITKEFWRILFLRHYRFFSPTFYVVLLLGIVGIFNTRVRAYVGRPAPWVLFGAGLAFIFAMKQLFCEQYHVSLSLLPYFAVASALVIVHAVERRVGLVLAIAGALLTYGWHVKEVVTFKYAFLRPAELVPLRAELDAHDHNGYLYSTLSFTPSFRYSLNRHMISMYDVGPERLAAYFESHPRELGGHAPYIVHYEPFLEASEDTKVVAYYAGNLRKLWWLRDPWWSRSHRQSTFRKRVDKQLEVIASISDKVVESGSFTMYRINPDKLRDVLYPRPSRVPERMTAESVEFARAAGAQESISAPETIPQGTVRYTLHHRPMRLLIVAGGGDRVPPARPALDFTLRLPQDVSRAQQVTMTVIPTRSDQTLHVPGGDIRLGAPGIEQRVIFQMPARGSVSKIEEVPVELSINQPDSQGRGVGLKSIELGALP